LRVDDLFNINPELKYISGAGGGGRSIKYVDVVEIPEGGYWTKEGDFIITTGYFFKNNNSLFLDFISSLIEKRASGLGIKLGKYINVITEDIIELSEKYDFPLINVPIYLSYREISKPILKFIANENDYITEQFQYSTVEMLYLSIISQADFQVSRIIENARYLSINNDTNRCLCIVRYNLIIDEKMFSNVYGKLKKQYASNNIICIHQTDLKKITCVFELDPLYLYPKKINTFFEEFYHMICAAISENVPVHIGISECFKTLVQMNSAYRNADSALRIGCITQRQSHLFYYSDCIVDELLYDNLEHDSLKLLYQNYVIKLIQYDKQKNTNFYHTLIALDKYGFNMNKTSDSLFIHRNTLYKRAEKIGEILQCDLEDPQTRFIISLSLKYGNLVDPF